MNKVLVIGGSNIDYNASSKNRLIERDSNIGNIKISYGGVARNIVENLARLDDDVSFITFIGNDTNGKALKEHLLSLNVKVYNPELDYPSSSYLAIYDNSGDMKVAICDTAILDNCPFDEVLKFDDVIRCFDMIILDANINEEIIDGLFKKYKNKKFLIEAVSANKVRRYKNYLKNIYLFKSNLLEAQSLLDEPNISSIEAAKKLMNMGCKNVVITEGPGPVIIGENNDVVFITPKPLDKIVNANGAGDALFSGLIHGLIKGKSLVESTAFGIKVSQATLMSEESIDKNIGRLKDLLK